MAGVSVIPNHRSLLPLALFVLLATGLLAAVERRAPSPVREVPPSVGATEASPVQPASPRAVGHRGAERVAPEAGLPLAPPTPIVSAVKSVDKPTALVGETLNYQVVVACAGSIAGGMSFDDTLDTNLTLVPGSLKASPVAVDDVYPCTGNLSLSVPAGSGLLSNDYLGLNPSATLTAHDATSAGGGAVSVAADGSFTYEPAAGYNGTDTFTYTLSSTAGSSVGTVSLTVSNRIWFINSAAGACTSSCDGRLSHPFTSLSAFIAAGSGNIGDRIFIYTGTGGHSGNLSLKFSQRLIGQGDALNATTLGFTPAAYGPALPGAGAKPTLTGTLSLANSVTVLALDWHTTTGVAISGVGVSGVTVADQCTVTADGGVALYLRNADGSFTFRSVSANGNQGGILWNNASQATGSLSVTGDGSTAGSGGSLHDIWGADGDSTGYGCGVYLNNASNVSLSCMQFSNFQNYALRGFSVNNFTMAQCSVTGTSGNSASYYEGCVAFGANTGEPGGPANGLTGSAAITNCDIGGGYQDDFRLANQSGSLNRLTFTGTTFGPNSVTTGNDGILIEGESAALLNVTVQSCTFSGARGSLFALILNGNNTADLVFQGNTLSNPAAYAASAGSNGLTLISGNNVASGAFTTFNISNNTFRDANGHAVLVVKSTDPGTLSGTLNSNTIGVQATSNSGSAAGDGIKVQTAGLGTLTANVTNNHIYQYNNFGIELLTGGGASATSGTLNATVSGNVVSNPGTGGLPMNGVHLNGGTNVGDTFAICADIRNNSLAGSGANGGTDFRLRQRQATTGRLPGYGGANNDNTAVVTFVQGSNPGGPTGLASNTVPTGGGFVGGGACALPSTFSVPAPGEGPSQNENLPALTEGRAAGLIPEALGRLAAAGLAPEEIARLETVTVRVADLQGGLLAEGSLEEIVLDRTAAGRGWFVDDNPWEDGEFEETLPDGRLRAGDWSPARSGVDLLSVLLTCFADEVEAAAETQGEAAPGPVLRLRSSAPEVGVRSLTLFAGPSPEPPSAAPAAAPAPGPAAPVALPSGERRPDSGETIALTIGTLPSGKSVTVQFAATIANPLVTPALSVTNQCAVSGSNFPTVTSNLVTTWLCSGLAVLNPTVTTGQASVAFSQAFTASGGTAPYTFATTSTLPAGLSLASDGTLSGTPTQVGSFPIVVTATDAHGCAGTGTTYTLVLGCPTVTVANPATATGTVNTPFGQSFTLSVGIAPATFSTSSTLPAGLTLAASGTLSGTPTQLGTFPIVVQATDANGCTGTGATYNLVISCQTIAVTPPPIAIAKQNQPFTATFTRGGGVAPVTFSTTSPLPAGITLASNGVLSGTPTQRGIFPLSVTATDAYGCTGTHATAYSLAISCVTVDTPALGSNSPDWPSVHGSQTGRINRFAVISTCAGKAFPGMFTTTGARAYDAYTFANTSASDRCVTATLETRCGTSLFPVAYLDSFVPANPATNYLADPGSSPTANISYAFILPAGHSAVVVVHEVNPAAGCGAGYKLAINGLEAVYCCPTITVSNPAVASGTAGAAFNQTFTQTGGTAPVTFSLATGTLPPGLTLSGAGVLSGTPTANGTFPVTVTATDADGCTGTGPTYNLVIACPTITLAALSNGTPGTPYSQSATASPAGTYTYAVTAGSLPPGLALNPSTGAVTGTPSTPGPYPFTITATGWGTCTGSQAYSLTIACPTITLAALPSGAVGTPYTGSAAATPAGSYTYAVSVGSLPPGLALNASTGAVTGTPSTPGLYPFTITATEWGTCTGTRSYSLPVADATGCFPGLLLERFDGATPPALPPQWSTSVIVPGTGVPPVWTTRAGGVNPNATPVPSSPNVLSFNSFDCDSGTQALAAAQTPMDFSRYHHAQVDFKIYQYWDGGIFSSTGEGLIVRVSTDGATWSSASGLITNADPSLPTGTGRWVSKVVDLSAYGGQATLYIGFLGVSQFGYNVHIDDVSVTGTCCPTLTVTNPAIASGQAGISFSQSFTQSGGALPVTFATSDPLPAGLTLATDGTLSGTPTVLGSFPIHVTATDANGCTGTGAAYSLTIACPTITLTALAGGTANTPYSQSAAASPAGTYTYAVTAGSLPPGLALNASTGALTGTPTTNGTYTFTLTATGWGTCTGSQAYSVTIACPTIALAALAGGTANTPYSQSAAASPAGTYTYAVTAGSLPPGLALNASTGALTGTPTANGTYTFTLTATGWGTCTGSQAYSVTIACPTIALAALANGTANLPYSQSAAASPAGTYTYAVTVGSLPPGLALNTSTGAVTGTPTTNGTYTFTLTATGWGTCTGSQAYSVTIACPTIALAALTGGTANTPYSQSAAASPAGTYTYAVTVGSLPPGLALNTSTGAVTGTPTTNGTYTFTLTATGWGTCTGSQAYSVTIACPTITLTPTSLPDALAGAAYSQALTAAPAGTTYSYALTAGVLPPGMTLSSAGLLSGTPTHGGPYTFTVTATGWGSCTGSQTYTLAVTCPAITVSPATLPAGVLGASYSATFTAAGGLGGYTFAVTAGSLPAGLTLSSSGLLSGTIGSSGSFSFTVTATDAAGCTGSQSYSLAISAYDLSLLDDGGHTQLCVNTFNGTYAFTVFSGTGAGTYAGLCTIAPGRLGMMVVTSYGSRATLSATYSERRHVAQAAFTTPGRSGEPADGPPVIHLYKATLSDSDTLDDPPCGGQPTR